jgi:hypothetical protein
LPLLALLCSVTVIPLRSREKCVMDLLLQLAYRIVHLPRVTRIKQMRKLVKGQGLVEKATLLDAREKVERSAQAQEWPDGYVSVAERGRTVPRLRMSSRALARSISESGAGSSTPAVISFAWIESVLMANNTSWVCSKVVAATQSLVMSVLLVDGRCRRFSALSAP